MCFVQTSPLAHFLDPWGSELALALPYCRDQSGLRQPRQIGEQHKKEKPDCVYFIHIRPIKYFRRTVPRHHPIKARPRTTNKHEPSCAVSASRTVVHLGEKAWCEWLSVRIVPVPAGAKNLGIFFWQQHSCRDASCMFLLIFSLFPPKLPFFATQERVLLLRHVHLICG